MFSPGARRWLEDNLADILVGLGAEPWLAYLAAEEAASEASALVMSERLNLLMAQSAYKAAEAAMIKLIGEGQLRRLGNSPIYHHYHEGEGTWLGTNTGKLEPMGVVGHEFADGVGVNTTGRRMETHVLQTSVYVDYFSIVRDVLGGKPVYSVYHWVHGDVDDPESLAPPSEDPILVDKHFWGYGEYLNPDVDRFWPSQRANRVPAASAAGLVRMGR